MIIDYFWSFLRIQILQFFIIHVFSVIPGGEGHRKYSSFILILFQDLHFCTYGNTSHCSVYGQKGLKVSPTLAAYANGVAVSIADHQ